mmetsp:Transcript_101726/g.255051  ORF Transcript_101726/g.255051 Transcript_101726/m.255051 type:complete len:465 (+) Transcript_101726:98-1492(+)
MVACKISGSFIITVAVCVDFRSVTALVRGVAPESQDLYKPGSPIHCKGEKGETLSVQFEAVNDEYCDCADGLDEPGTGACAGQEQTLFHCPNEGSTPQLIYASRVDDGICDCCDGSDEAGMKARNPGVAACTNMCAEQGKIEKEQRAARMEELKSGLAKKEENQVNAVKEREQARADIQRLEAELPALEAALEEAKKVAAEAASTDMQAEVEELRKKVAQQQQTIEALQKQVNDCKAKAKGAIADVAGKEKPAEGEKKQVSEYAKWMDGAGETPGAIEGEQVGEEEADDFPDDLDEASLPSAPTVSKGSGAKSEKSKEVTEAETKVSGNKAEVQKLKKKATNLEDDTRLGYSSLTKECLSKHDGQYTYKVCFYDDARQDHVSLGRWKGWEGPREAHFTEGQMCPGGPARMLRVIFECGSKDALLDISEPSRCVYEARITSPGACDAEDAAKLEKPPVKHPKDEL